MRKRETQREGLAKTDLDESSTEKRIKKSRKHARRAKSFLEPGQGPEGGGNNIYSKLAMG